VGGFEVGEYGVCMQFIIFSQDWEATANQFWQKHAL